LKKTKYVDKGTKYKILKIGETQMELKDKRKRIKERNIRLKRSKGKIFRKISQNTEFSKYGIG